MWSGRVGSAHATKDDGDVSHHSATSKGGRARQVTKLGVLKLTAGPGELRDSVSVARCVASAGDDHLVSTLQRYAVGELLWEDRLEVKPLCVWGREDESVSVPDLRVAIPWTTSGEVRTSRDD
jgi:hypothetical protein